MHGWVYRRTFGIKIHRLCDILRFFLQSQKGSRRIAQLHHNGNDPERWHEGSFLSVDLVEYCIQDFYLLRIVSQRLSNDYQSLDGSWLCTRFRLSVCVSVSRCVIKVVSKDISITNWWTRHKLHHAHSWHTTLVTKFQCSSHSRWLTFQFRSHCSDCYLYWLPVHYEYS